ncbi:MAG: TIR domain-containing protein, partial [Promethearchaeota archaeon]
MMGSRDNNQQLDYAFISYSSKDSVMYNILEQLEARGVNLWYDKKVHLAEDWRKILAKKIKKCKIFMVFISSNSMESEHVYSECSLAFDYFSSKENKLHLSFVQIEDVPITDRFRFILTIFHGNPGFWKGGEDALNSILAGLEMVTFAKLKEHRENLPIYSEDGEHIGIMKRTHVHSLSIWHKTCNIAIITADGKFIIQYRSDMADIDKRKLDFFGGHMLRGESYRACALRELSEETGLEPERIVEENLIQIGEEGQFKWPPDDIKVKITSR